MSPALCGTFAKTPNPWILDLPVIIKSHDCVTDLQSGEISIKKFTHNLETFKLGNFLATSSLAKY